MTSIKRFRKTHSLVATLLMVIIAFLLIAMVTFYFAVTTQAKRDATFLAVDSARHSALVIRPMVAAKDWTSISVIFNDLISSPFLSGIELLSPAGDSLVKAGNSVSDTQYQLPLSFQSQPLGTLALSIDTQYSQKQLLRLLMLAMAMTLAALAALLYVAALASRKQSIALQSLQNQLDDVLQSSPPYAEPVAPQTPAPARQHTETIQAQHSMSTESPAELQSLTELSPDELLGPLSEEAAGEDITTAASQNNNAPATDLPQSDTDRPQESLSGYSFDAQMDQILPEEQALYLLYIDPLSGHANYLEDDEREQRLSNYQGIAQKVAQSYQTQLNTLEEGGFVMAFKANEKGTQGIDAICAALTFTLTMKAVNKALISKMSPVLNVRIALVRGTEARPKSLLDEAKYLTRHTESNELISHTALTEVPFIQDTVLTGAKLRRAEEDKVEILGIEAKKQALFEAQAQQLCTIR
ncbi:MAG: hypothetical protein ACPGMR_06980 [Pontibacterium sp.]